TLKVGEQLKLFDPKTNRIQVVGHSMLGSSWMGSHFTNDDLVKETRLARDYSLSLIKKWEAPAPVGGNGTFYRIAMIPKPTAPVAWGKIVYELWESPKAIAPSSATYFRKASDTTPARTMTFSDVKKLGGRWLPVKMTITVTSKPGEHTKLVYTKLRLNVDIPKGKFTEQALRH
ncbi:MAG: outer membrane lipoprotein-sorting protein, partial [Deltaproteobacteria bacterium]|nr:outer membrane lipoprotein-sorting protein [Deltaproteobacteria bacterium]